jgi:polysaccharide pyruvyl transferase WcaK-like protein
MRRFRKNTKTTIAFYGHFNSTNFGNESTLQAIIYHLRRFFPHADISCICVWPETTIATHDVEVIPLSEAFVKFWVPRHPLNRILRKVLIGLPSEPYRWVKGLMRLRRTDMLIIPGTGLLTDAYCLLGWGPYNLLKWSLIAKICRCKLLFVSTGAGPVYGILGRCFVKSVLSLADYRSYRDISSMEYLKSIGFRADKDPVYPDLAFSLPVTMISDPNTARTCRSVVGLGVMEYAGKYSTDNPSNGIYRNYLESMVALARWLLSHEYDVRLLSGDLADMDTRQEFRDLLRERLSPCDGGRIIDEPIYSVEDLLSQIAATDSVVATRFHNVLFALLCNKPVISISFHHKCESLMSAIGLSEYCLDINDLKADKLIEKFRDLEMDTSKIKPLIREKVGEFRKALDEQYELIFNQ